MSYAQAAAEEHSPYYQVHPDADPGTVPDVVDTLARTIYGEARGDGEAGMTAVACVVLNRVERPGWWGNTIVSVCLARLQFSCWNPDPDPDSDYAHTVKATTADPDFALATRIAQAAVDRGVNTSFDPTLGADSYYDKSMDDDPPSWAKDAQHTVDIGSQHFFIVYPTHAAPPHPAAGAPNAKPLAKPAPSATEAQDQTPALSDADVLNQQELDRIKAENEARDAASANTIGERLPTGGSQQGLAPNPPGQTPPTGDAGGTGA